MTVPIHLISGPRNISTALMYSFGNRDDFSIIDEPLYAYYLLKTRKPHPGREDILASMNSDLNIVLDSVFFNKKISNNVFIKNMAHHLIDVDLSILKKMKNVFLIRHPRKLIASFSKVIENPTLQDIGVKDEYEIYNYCLDNDIPRVVIDSFELLKNPKKVLSELCLKLNISFSDSMLKWKAGPRKEDGIWAKYWYHSVHETTEFKPLKSETPFLKEHLMPLYESAISYYEFLFDKSIKA